jgi:histidine kinase/DNA gyrase B/HSP90-like ATPase
MTETFATRVELLAQDAQALPAFSGLNLLHIRREVTKVLGLIGRSGFFEEYTRHDISHIDRMLAMLDWLIPSDTWEQLTPADALLLVLAIYFHDLGLLVTREEYEARNSSQLERFRTTLFDSPGGVDYRSRVEALGSDGADRFIYQEFVRAHHGERIRAWISGQSPGHLGAANGAAAEVTALLTPLTGGFRDDLGLICESHHADDLDQVATYQISRPYGSSDSETANVQYAAMMLRTADLLHITSDRTPSVLYKLISPADPVSQQEWAKQQAVESVRSKPGLDADNNVDLEAHRDTIEVFAEFSDENGFFGLTAYLAYARRQLHQTFEWAQVSIKRHGSRYHFPWRYIDEERIRTKGFLRESFEFTLDQAKVLDLLTGHTLYNNTNVVVRELVQNSLDAIRLHEADAEPNVASSGHVEVRWDSTRRVLIVKDNGTGMTQAIIERHLLTVGSSRYQDPEFRRQYPTFSPISRFGIGVLSTFMVSDAVTITTCPPDEPEARRLSLRSVHGRYLIRLLSKDDRDVKDLAPHGTEVELQIRPSATMRDVAEVMEGWVVVPRCQVTLTIDDNEPTDIGFGNVESSLKSMMGLSETEMWERKEGDQEPKRQQIRIVEQSRNGVDLAFAVQWSDYFKEWAFVRGGRLRDEEARPNAVYGTCIEGIRVARGAPGFRDFAIAAVANATGLEAPKTDVARSGLEDTPELRQTHMAIYELLCGFVEQELNELISKRGFSVTWAAQEARLLLSPLVRAQANDRELLLDIASKIPLLVVDDDGQRALVSPFDMAAKSHFWTVYSAFFRSAELLLRELPTTASVGSLSDALGVPDFEPPDGPLVTTAPRDDPVTERAFMDKEVATVVIRRGQRRVDLEWRARTESARWRALGPHDESHPEIRELARTGPRGFDIIVAAQEIRIDGRSGEAGIYTDGAYYVFWDTAVASYLNGVLDSIGSDRDRDAELLRAYLVSVMTMALGQRGFEDVVQNAGELREWLERGLSIRTTVIRDILERYSSWPALEDSLLAEPIAIFNPDVWRRGPVEQQEF